MGNLRLIQFQPVERAGSLWIDVLIDGEVTQTLGPFDTKQERGIALDDIAEAMDESGAERAELQ
jgi:hypothetical protein